MYRAETLARLLNIAAQTPFLEKRSDGKRSELLNGVRQDGQTLAGRSLQGRGGYEVKRTEGLKLVVAPGANFGSQWGRFPIAPTVD